MRTSRPALLGIVIAAIGGATVATILTLATVSFLTPQALPGPVPADTGAQADGTAVAAAVVAPRNPELVSLQTALDDANAQRKQLADSLMTLNRDLVELQDSVRELSQDSSAAASQLTTEEPPIADAGDPAPEALPTEATPQAADNRNASTADRLVAAGVDPDTASALERRQAAWQLERLELLDRAAREGWEDTDREQQELDALEASRPDLRTELGDEAFDRFLLESGRRNRVGITAVIPGSAADAAGLQPGDVVVSYADQRVFNRGDLVSATRGGVRDEPVTMAVERDGRTVLLIVTRGPLGVSMRRQSSE